MERGSAEFGSAGKGAAGGGAAATADTGFDCSIVIALFNKRPYVARALASIVAQTVRPREIIIIDDGSTDAGAQVAAGFDTNGIALQIVRQANAGVSAARNRGIALASGTWVAFLDADDVYLPWLLSEFATLASQCPRAELLGAHFREVDSSRMDTLAHSAVMQDSAEAPANRGYVDGFYDRWWRGSLFFTSSVAVKRSRLLTLCEPFPVGERRGEDIDLFYRLVEQGPVAWTSRVSALYARSVADSLTADGIEAEPLPAFQRLLTRSALPSFPERERAGVRRCLATYWMTVARGAIRRGDFAGAWRLLQAPITVHRPIYWLRTVALLAATMAGKACGLKGQLAARSNG